MPPNDPRMFTRWIPEEVTRGRPRQEGDRDQRETEARERLGPERDRDQRETETRERPIPERDRDLRETETRGRPGPERPRPERDQDQREIESFVDLYLPTYVEWMMKSPRRIDDDSDWMLKSLRP